MINDHDWAATATRRSLRLKLQPRTWTVLFHCLLFFVEISQVTEITMYHNVIFKLQLG